MSAQQPHVDRLPEIGHLRMGETIIENDCTGEGMPIYSADKGNSPWAYSTHFNRINRYGSIIIGARGTIGFPRLPKDAEFGATQTTIVFTPDRQKYLPEYIHFALQQVDFVNLGAQQAVPMLTVGNLGSVTILRFPLLVQTKIAEVLSTVDQAIEQTEALVAKQQRIQTGLMQNLFTRGIDEHGNLRSEKTHPFKDSPLGRIPVEWDVTSLGDTGDWFSGGTPSKTNKRYWGGDVPWVCPKDIKKFELSTTIDKITLEAGRCGSRLMPRGTVFIVIRGMILAHTFPVGLAATQMAFNQDVKAIVARSGLCDRYLAYWLAAHAQDMLKLATTATHGTKRFDMDELYSMPVAIPAPTEQAAITRILDEQQAFIERTRSHTDKLHSLKTGLMQDLLTGKVWVMPLLDAQIGRH
jgi:type I restriction enzyme S subunit